jgi:hypothetical protein
MFYYSLGSTSQSAIFGYGQFLCPALSLADLGTFIVDSSKITAKNSRKMQRWNDISSLVFPEQVVNVIS